MVELQLFLHAAVLLLETGEFFLEGEEVALDVGVVGCHDGQ